jgi:general secretion pathway protein B
MSFILDALKKSEVERQRQAIPGLMDSRPPPPRSKFPLWAVALIALLVINVVILAVVLTRGAPATAPATASQSTPTTGAPATSATAPSAASPAGVTSDHFSPMDAPHPSDARAPVYAPEIPPDYAGALRRSPHAASSSDTSARHDARVPDPVLTDSSPADSEVLPSINEINLADQPALANLHLDVHVYATQPSERFVYINMRRYREGATLAEGPVLERIRRDGVVLNYQGLRFVLPRQQ